jgi:hypothetical protein
MADCKCGNELRFITQSSRGLLIYWCERCGRLYLLASCTEDHWKTPRLVEQRAEAAGGTDD